MAAENLARIKEVSFYVGLTENAQECFDMKRYLEENGIPYKLLAYMDDSVHEVNFRGMSTWTWGPDGETRTFTKFPILTWEEYDEDFNQVLESATTVDEVKTKLLPYKALIKL